MPQSIPQPAPTPGATSTPGQPNEGTPTPANPATEPSKLSETPAATAAQTSVELKFTADRNELFTAWNAMANLADIAGKVQVTVTAQKADGLDKAKLQNGVIEPLREANLIQ